MQQLVVEKRCDLMWLCALQFVLSIAASRKMEEFETFRDLGVEP